ncbi:MAG: hypothetical protein JGK30_20915 [Microcoleus sp. PH2017_40_RAT_O_B]|uniref:hypothetical protein n=1 Tax=unclassified Microcoleus TaxID=2642155 RepID=UPI001DD0A59A|nr:MULTISPECIES: hypothetical protein [unclassified Microcoleus]MCC3574343.1 hypothetical protein [Microcoleus sp. PH2017_34_RAT_O_A]MCC3611865.1 hypothetical protein [Microcoleus sp. PH2017_40_RAT_O_B]
MRSQLLAHHHTGDRPKSNLHNLHQLNSTNRTLTLILATIAPQSCSRPIAP